MTRAEIGLSAKDKGREQRRKSRAAHLFATDRQFARAASRDDVSRAASRDGLRLVEVVETLMRGYADRPALGQRAYELVPDPATGRTSANFVPHFDEITYQQLWERAEAVAAALVYDVNRPVCADNMLLLLGFPSTDYVTVDLASLRLGAVSVPLQTGAATSRLTAIAAEAHAHTLAVSVEHLPSAVEITLASEAIDRIIVMDYRPGVSDDHDALQRACGELPDALRDVTVETVQDLIAQGKASPPIALPPVRDGDETLALLIYTSGSTGTPKGAMYPERMVATHWGGPMMADGTLPALSIQFMPLSHVAGRISLMGTLSRGGTAYFVAKSDLSTFFEDLALIRPTSLSVVPRICEMFYQHYHSELARRGSAADSPDIQATIKTDMRQNLLGGRVLAAGFSSAPLSADLIDFMESVLDVHLVNGYGSTEDGMVWLDGKVLRPPVIDYKLADVPELGYFSTDNPHPRGELLIKTQTIIPGYYLRPELNAEIFDANGYYRTGDVVAEVGPDQLAYVDRRSNVLKLSQGEFVAVARLESVFATSELVSQIYLYGSSEQPYLLAVIVPAAPALQRYGMADALGAALMQSLRHIAKDVGLQSYEIPRDVIIETEPFSTENGLLSDTRKVLRPRLKERYAPRLERLYAELAEGQARELHDIRQQAAAQPVLDTVRRAASAVLEIALSEVDPDLYFADLGGDSLSALTYSNLLNELFAADVPVTVIANPANTVRSIAAHIEHSKRADGQAPTVATVHSQTATVIRAADLKLHKFIDPAILTAAPDLPAPCGPARTVLLTGANGWLGRFLTLEWLERCATIGGKLVVVVRGKDQQAARTRLDAAFDSGDENLLARYHRLADSLEVLAGDFSQPHLGLEAQTWARLADEVDLIMHPGALVNHVLPYHQMFGPNVVGTAHIIELAITTRLKPVSYLSTVAVAFLLEPSEFQEDADIREVSPERPVDDSYGNGYGNSKWAGEVLLREAHDLCGLPVRVFRSDMILAHPSYRGQLNVPDQFTRLLLSILATTIAPKSFYQLGADGNRPRAHYDGIPVDFSAQAITALGAEAWTGYHSYNVFNPHRDGIGLDEFVDWLIQAGYPIVRIDDYAQWLARFETALRALPEDQRRHSLLPLLAAFATPEPPTDGSPYQNTAFHNAVRQAKIGTAHDIPHIHKDLITKYANDLRHLGLL